MVSCKGKNTCVCAVKGNFDDAQSGVKAIFREADLPENIRLSSANSINIGRLAPQVAYYFKAYRDLLLSGEITMGDKVNFVVPTGNFGDILAGYFAMHMGLPVGRLICASNRNNVLSDFFANGIYDQDRNNITTLKTQYINLENSELDLASRLTESKKKAYAFFKDEVIEEYKKTEFAKQIQQAAVLTECAAEQSYSALIYEKLMELYLQEPLIFEFEKMDDMNQAIRLDLRKRLKQNPNDISSKFALGKNLLYFGTKNKHINEAVNILSSLATRPLKTISTAKDMQEPSTPANSK